MLREWSKLSYPIDVKRKRPFGGGVYNENVLKSVRKIQIINKVVINFLKMLQIYCFTFYFVR